MYVSRRPVGEEHVAGQAVEAGAQASAESKLPARLFWPPSPAREQRPRHACRAAEQAGNQPRVCASGMRGSEIVGASGKDRATAGGGYGGGGRTLPGTGAAPRHPLPSGRGHDCVQHKPASMPGLSGKNYSNSRLRRTAQFRWQALLAYANCPKIAPSKSSALTSLVIRRARHGRGADPRKARPDARPGAQARIPQMRASVRGRRGWRRAVNAPSCLSAAHAMLF